MATLSTSARATFASSAYASSSTLLNKQWLPSQDIAKPQALEAAVRARAFRGELILFSFDFCGISEALSLILTMRGVGFEHFAPMRDGQETCEALRLSLIHI